MCLQRHCSCFGIRATRKKNPSNLPLHRHGPKQLVIAETELRGMAGADLIVTAKLEDFSSMDYAKAKELLQKGYDAAAERA